MFLPSIMLLASDYLPLAEILKNDSEEYPRDLI